jgi:hypothetical protein
MCEDLQTEHLLDIGPLSLETDQTTIGTAIGESFVEKVQPCLMWLDTQASPLRMLWKRHYQPTCTGLQIGCGIRKQRPTFPLDSETIRLPPCR